MSQSTTPKRRGGATAKAGKKSWKNEEYHSGREGGRTDMCVVQ